MQNYEQLGAFYLGKEHDITQGTTSEDLVLYDSKDLTTHAVCVGMTGSGKTGLCVGLLEEAAMDGIPALVIDPKGDLGNLMLTFPDLLPSDFRPWIDESEAKRKGVTPDAYAKKTSETWAKGLASWQQDGDRIRRLKEAADICIYTPGSSAGRPLTILRSFSAPPQAVLDDSDALRDRIQAAVSGLLALLGVEADPIRSREHMLLSNILSRAWSEGRSLDLPSIIGEIQKPPFDRVGVFDLESFYPAKERFELALTVNGILASPGFASWTEGDPLNIGNLLTSPTGKPRIAILSIAHLSDPERMFFVTILLNEMLSWMRTQPGTGSLRAMLYMDEIFGYFPPTANPPSKKPMLTLLKQARAFGVGVVLATQNPVDLDYKGLSNTGTWFIGRLQTERDKARVLDGLEGASSEAGAAFDRQNMERVLAQLGNRVFLMHNVHEDGPRIFETRWVMSYLRGPLTRSQIQMLSHGDAPAVPAATPAPALQPLAAPAVAAATAPEPVPDAAPAITAAPVIPPSVQQFWLPLKGAPGDSARLVYRPSLAGIVRLHFVSARAKVDVWTDLSLLTPLPEDGPFIEWGDMEVREDERMTLASGEARPGAYADLMPDASKATNYKSWEKQLKSHLYQYRGMTLWHCPDLKQYSKAGESEGDFRSRLALLSREKRDINVEKLRAKYAKKLGTLQGKVRRAEEKVSREQDQYKQQKSSTIISISATIVGALFGRKVASYGTVGRAASAIKGAGRASKEKGEVARAEEALEELQEQLDALGVQMEADLEAARIDVNVEAIKLNEVPVRPRKTDINVARFGLCWKPYRVGADGIADPLY